MAINVNQLNASGLASLAGNQMPNYNLPLFGDTSVPGQAIFDAAKQQAVLDQQQQQALMQQQMGLFQQQQLNDRQKAELANRVFTTQLSGQNQMNVAGLNAQVQMAKQAQQGEQFDRTFGLEQQKVGIDADYKAGQLENSQQANAINKLKAELEARAKLTEQERAERAAAAGAYLIERQKIQDPAQAAAFDQSYMNMAVKNKIYTKEEADAFLSADPNTRSMLANQDYLLTQKAGDLAKALGGAGETTIETANGDRITIGGSQSKKLGEEIAKTDAKKIEEASTEAKIARETLQLTKEFRSLNKQVYTGVGSGAVQWSSKALRGILGPNFDYANSSSGDALKALQMTFAQQRTQLAKGAISDRELDLYLSSVPGMEGSQEGNNRIADTMDAMALRKATYADFIRDWTDRYKSSSGADEQWQKFLDENPIMSQDQTGHLVLNKDNIKTYKSYLDKDYSKPSEAKADAGYSQADLEFTAQKHGLTVDEVKQRLGVK